jgi:hypothetical protein
MPPQNPLGWLKTPTEDSPRIEITNKGLSLPDGSGKMVGTEPLVDKGRQETQKTPNDSLFLRNQIHGPYSTQKV